MPPHIQTYSWLGKLVVGSVLFEISPSCSFFTLLSVIICVACDNTGYKLNVSTVMLSVVSREMHCSEGGR